MQSRPLMQNRWRQSSTPSLKQQPLDGKRGWTSLRDTGLTWGASLAPAAAPADLGVHVLAAVGRRAGGQLSGVAVVQQRHAAHRDAQHGVLQLHAGAAAARKESGGGEVGCA